MTRFGHLPEVVERLKWIQSADWFVTWDKNEKGNEEWARDPATPT